jgi:hypothetical protein
MYQLPSKYIQQGRNPASKVPIGGLIAHDRNWYLVSLLLLPVSIRHTTMTLQSSANPMPSIVTPQLKTRTFKNSRGPIHRRDKVLGISKMK